jgi:hypothetical protein
MARGRKKKSEGLGDTVEKVLEVTGIAKVAKWIMGEDCGCEERKQKLNKLFSYKKPLCLTENEYNYLNEFFNRDNKSSIKPTQATQLLKIYNRIFQKRNEPTTCTECWRTYLNELSLVYNEYKEEEKSETN